MPTPTILVPLDGSSYAEHAIPAAIGMARTLDARLELVRVRPLRSIAEDMESRPFTDQGPPSMERRYLDSIASRLGGTLPISVKMVRGDPATAIVERASEIGARLIVMATHARGGVRRAVLGSVADGVVRESVAPVMLIKPPPIEAELPAERRVTRVLVPLDGSLESAQMASVALQSLGIEVPMTLVRVISPEAALVPARGPNAGQAQDPERDLELVAERLREAGASVETRIVVGRDTAAAILDQAERSGARLIAMATRARRGPARTILGSVADEVLRGASCPVLLFRPLT